jgi:hypothetical protein
MRLVHMNGRIYDGLLGRFLSADTFVPNPGSLQSFNRYSYVQNNPLSRTDPTGYADKSDVILDGSTVYIKRNLWGHLVHALSGKKDVPGAEGYDVYCASPAVLKQKLLERRLLDASIQATLDAAIERDEAWQERAEEQAAEQELDEDQERAADEVTQEVEEHEGTDPDSQEMEQQAGNDARRDAARSGEGDGKIYRVPEEDTPSGKPYIGRAKDLEKRKQDSSDGRNRKNAEEIGSYPADDEEAGAQAEEDAIEDEGLENLDNKRHERKRD